MSKESEAKDQQLVNLHKERAQWEHQRTALEGERDAARAAAAQGGDPYGQGRQQKDRSLQQLNAGHAELERIRGEAVAKVETHVQEARSLAARDRERRLEKEREDKAKLEGKKRNDRSADSAQRDAVEAQLKGAEQARKRPDPVELAQKKPEEVERPRRGGAEADAAGGDRQSKPRAASGQRVESGRPQGGLPTGAELVEEKARGPALGAPATRQQRESQKALEREAAERQQAAKAQAAEPAEASEGSYPEDDFEFEEEADELEDSAPAAQGNDKQARPKAGARDPAANLGRPEPSATTSTKEYLAGRIAEREKDPSALSTSQKSLFQHTQHDKVEAMKIAQGELQATSQGLLQERMGEMRIDPRAAGAAGADGGLLVNDHLRNMSKKDLAKMNQSLGASLQKMTGDKNDKDYLQYMEDVLTDSSQSVPGYGRGQSRPGAKRTIQ